MRKHFAPYRPVVIRLWPHVQPMTYVFLLKNRIHLFIICSADIVFAGSQDDPHFPEVWIIVVWNIVYGVVKIYGIIIKAIRKLFDIKSSTHGETITCEIRMPESTIDGMIASKTAAGKSHSLISRFVLGPWNKFSRNHPVKFFMVPGPFVWRDGFIIPAIG